MGDRLKAVIKKDDIRSDGVEFRFLSYKHFKSGNIFIKITLLFEDWPHGL